RRQRCGGRVGRRGRLPRWRQWRRAGGGGGGPGCVQAEPLGGGGQRDPRDTGGQRGVEEMEEGGAGGRGGVPEEGEEGAGVARQELACGPSVHAVVGLLDGLLGGQPLLAGGGRPADAQEAGEVGDLEPTAAVEQEVAQQAGGVVVGALGLAEAEGG